VSPAFATELQQAVASRNGEGIRALQPQLAIDPTAISGRKDGNNVQIESELLKLNQNFMEHQLETQLVSGAMMKLRMAITGKA
jgi:flagellar basal body rod protein FlgB